MQLATVIANDFSTDKSQASVSFNIGHCTVADNEKRTLIEAFIKNGYQKAFQADISITMPVLLYIEDKKHKSALGLRNSKETFFVEQYLPKPVINYILETHPDTDYQDIIEIGHLYSNAKHLTLPLFLTTAMTAFWLKKRFCILCATEPLVNLLTKSGVQCYPILKAKEEKLLPCADQWGCYYASNPSIVYIDVEQIMTLVQKNRFYKKLFHRLEDKISINYHTLSEKL